MEFNVKKFSVTEFGKSKQRISREYKLEGEIIQKSKSERSLGVFISDNTSPEKHINKIVGETYKLMRRKKQEWHLSTWMKKG